VTDSLSRQLLLTAIGVVLVACAVLIVVTVIARLARTRRQRRADALGTPLRRSVLVVAAGEDDDGSARRALDGVRGSSAELVEETITNLLPKVHGPAAASLVEVLEGYGSIERARQRLTARSAVTRARAAWLLGLTRDRRHVTALQPLLGDRSAEVRLVVVEALGKLGDDAPAADIIETLRPVNGRPGVPASTVAETLMNLGVGIAGELRPALADEDATVRDVAARVSGHGLFGALAPELRRLLADDPSDVVRATAATSLGSVGGHDDVAALAAAMSGDRPPALRRSAAAALGELGQRAAVPVLEPLLADDDRRLAEIAADSLLALGAAGRVVLESVLDEDGRRGRAARGTLEIDRLRSAARRRGA
jgi:HEAT repeat protein